MQNQRNIWDAKSAKYDLQSILWPGICLKTKVIRVFVELQHFYPCRRSENKQYRIFCFKENRILFDKWNRQKDKKRSSIILSLGFLNSHNNFNLFIKSKGISGKTDFSKSTPHIEWKPLKSTNHFSFGCIYLSIQYQMLQSQLRYEGDTNSYIWFDLFTFHFFHFWMFAVAFICLLATEQ